MKKNNLRRWFASLGVVLSLGGLASERASGGDEQAWTQVHESAHAPVKKEKAAPSADISVVYDVLQDVCENYADAVFKELSPAILKVFLSFASILLMWKVGIEGVLRKSIDPLGLFRLLFLIAMLSGFIANPELFRKFFYLPIKEMTLNITSIVVDQVSLKTQAGVTKGDVNGMLCHVDKTFATMIDTGFRFVGSSYTNIGTILLGLILVGIFKLISVLFLFYIGDFFFGLMAMSALGPLFLACYLFPMTKGYSEAAIRSVVNSCLTVIFAGLAIGVCLALTVKIEMGAASTSIAGTEHGAWRYLCVGFLSLLFIRRAPQISASITGSADSGSSSLMVGAAMTAASMAKGAVMFGGGKIAALMGGANAALGGGEKQGHHSYV